MIIICEILFAIAYMTAAFVLREFIISKNGTLRKIMICYFSVEVFIFGGGAFYVMYWHKIIPTPVTWFLIFLTVPKDVVKLWLLSWLIKGRINRK